MNEETTNMRPAHYHSQPFDSSLVQETIYMQCIRNKKGFEDERSKKAMWVSFAVKHLLRCGLKDDIDVELSKAENYLHKARTSEWLE